MTVLDHFYLQNMFLMGMTWARIFFQGHFGHFWGPGKVFFQGLGWFLKFAGGFSDLRGDSCVICCFEKCTKLDPVFCKKGFVYMCEG